jgi:hypothetical protein
MPELTYDEKGFTCECGTRNDYPAYVKDHWGVRLVYSCLCQRQFILYRGKVQKITQGISEYQESEAFGD